MYAVSTNQIKDILLFNDNALNLIEKLRDGEISLADAKKWSNKT